MINPAGSSAPVQRMGSPTAKHGGTRWAKVKAAAVRVGAAATCRPRTEPATRPVMVVGTIHPHLRSDVEGTDFLVSHPG